MVFGATTFRQFVSMLAESTDESEVRDPWAARMRNLPATVVSSTLAGPLDWPDATVVSGDAVDVVSRLKAEFDVPLRSHGSLSLNWALLFAGLVDFVQVTVFPVITGTSGSSRPRFRSKFGRPAERAVLGCAATRTGGRSRERSEEVNMQRRVWGMAAVAAVSIVSGAAVAGASAPPGESMPGHDMSGASEPVPGTLTDDGSGEATSAEAEAFCEAVVATEAAFNSEDEAMIGSAVEALTASAEPVGMAETVGALLGADPESEEFGAQYSAIIEYMKGNCGYAQMDAVATEYHFGGVPTELPAGPMIISLENAGEQVHELILMRINDDVTLSVEELLALPEEEAGAMATPAAFVFAFPGTVSSATTDLTPGRYVALCFLPQGATPDVLAQLEELGVDGPEDTIPADAGLELGPPHFTEGMVVEITVA